MTDGFYVPLRNGGVAVIDAADRDMVLGYEWFRHDAKRTHSYAAAYVRGRRVAMHRYLLGVGDRELEKRVEALRAEEAFAGKVPQ